jgi:hypothetical protein
MLTQTASLWEWLLFTTNRSAVPQWTYLWNVFRRWLYVRPKGERRFEVSLNCLNWQFGHCLQAKAFWHRHTGIKAGGGKLMTGRASHGDEFEGTRSGESSMPTSVNNLAYTFYRQGRTEEATQLLERDVKTL